MNMAARVKFRRHMFMFMCVQSTKKKKAGEVACEAWATLFSHSFSILFFLGELKHALPFSHMSDENSN